MLEVVTPLAKGQRVLVEGPAGAGATMLLLEVARGVQAGSQVIAAVVDARPEELAGWRETGAELSPPAPSTHPPTRCAPPASRSSARSAWWRTDRT